MTWTPIPDVNNPGWGSVTPPPAGAYAPVNDAQTPNWMGGVAVRYGAFQIGPFQTNYQQGVATDPWNPVDDTEVPGWVPA